ncbi:MAG: hypothetical protein HYU57_05825 [Micavibrio aeruginosavorus]|nr:hypothetical protein [Micavibrio aeruginosavorus]
MIKQIFQTVLVLAFALQALIPAGFMPGSAMAGTPVVICSGMGQMTILLDGDGQPVEQQDHDRNTTHAPCPWSVFPVSLTPPQVFSPASLPAFAAPAYGPEINGLFKAASLYRPNATAPPALFA